MQDDPDLVRRVKEGEIDAFELLMRKHQKTVFASVSKRVPASDVEDVAQQVFVDAYQALGRYSERMQFHAWIATIAARRCCDYWRSKYRRRQVEFVSLDRSHVDWLRTIAAAAHEEFDRRCSLAEAREVLDWVLGRLDSDDRMLVSLVYFEDQPLKDAAHALNWGLPKTKVRLMRARRKMKALITQLLEVDRNEE